jgi:hypothetical protein
MIVTNANGRAFFVRTVLQGDRYGLGDRLTHDNADPMIEFYDYQYANVRAFGPRGQFVSRYYVSTLAKHPKGAGLCLDGGVPEWSVDGRALAPVLHLATQLYTPRASGEDC